MQISCPQKARNFIIGILQRFTAVCDIFWQYLATKGILIRLNKQEEKKFSRKLGFLRLSGANRCIIEKEEGRDCYAKMGYSII